ncbi:MAG: class III extradiol ring-cleavage dioxygenase [Cyanobacteria bacterium P01_G01_bin.54]
MTESSSQPRILYLSHGGGPLPLLADPGHQEMVENLQAIAAQLPKPKAIVLISAHWEANQATMTRGANPPLIYDYYGFPEPAYQITYPAPGAPKLADRIFTLLQKRDIAASLTEERGFDHGLFVPLKIMYPAADIPSVQLSLVKGLDAQTHIEMGRAIAPLADENILIIGSGFSFHNLPALRAPVTPEAQSKNKAFEQWLIDTCANPELNETERANRLLHWDAAPAARYCHPREEHLLPLHVCYGAAGRACRQFFELTIMGKKASVYLW